jgi:molybdopterin-guanine dinucleotide biosynthesis protein A
MISHLAILAGGKASRMHGRPKQWLPFRGRPMIAHMLGVVTPIFEKIIVVSDEVPGLYADYPSVTVVPDEFPGKGPLAGIHAALNAAGGQATMVLACDLPFIEKDIIIDLCSAFEGPFDALVPRHPQGFEPLFAIYGPACLKVAGQLLKDRRRVRILTMLDAVRTHYYNMEYHRTFTNFNTPEDLQQAEK